MSKKEEFKEFIKTKPELVDYVKNKEMTWQDFYEMYDIYGSDASVWNKYDRAISFGAGKIGDIVKNIDVDSIQKHIETAQKALGFVQDLTTKGEVPKMPSAPTSPRPINKFFED